MEKANIRTYSDSEDESEDTDIYKVMILFSDRYRSKELVHFYFSSLEKAKSFLESRNLEEFQEGDYMQYACKYSMEVPKSENYDENNDHHCHKYCEIRLYDVKIAKVKVNKSHNFGNRVFHT